jgi:D-alanyl-D-alanine carboxypeptidase
MDADEPKDPSRGRDTSAVSPALGIPSDYAVKRRLTLQPEATELVSIASGSEGREVRLAPAAAVAWKRMRDAASGEGITLLAISGFRSIERQAEIIQRKLKAGETIDAVLKSVAAPGYSEHHSGCAIDIGVPDEEPLTEGFAMTAGFHWLQGHAGDFGFRLSYPRHNDHGMTFEPWHWRFHSVS